MPIRPDSRMRRERTTIFGWKDKDGFCLSLKPRESGAPFNTYPTALEALQEASRRHIAITWEDPAVIK